MKFSPLTSHSGFHSEWNFLSGTKFYSGFILTKNGLLSAGLKIAGAKNTRARTPLVERFGFIMWMHHNFILERKSIRNASHSCIIWTAPLINLHSYVPTYDTYLLVVPRVNSKSWLYKVEHIGGGLSFLGARGYLFFPFLIVRGEKQLENGLLCKHWFTSLVWNFCRRVADVPPRQTSPAAMNEEKRLFCRLH